MLGGRGWRVKRGCSQGFTEKEMFEQRLGGGEGRGLQVSGERTFLAGSGQSWYKGPEAGCGLKGLRNNTEATWLEGMSEKPKQ